MAKSKKVNVRDLMLGIVIGFFLALILSSIVNIIIFKKIIRENRVQSEQIQLMLRDN